MSRKAFAEISGISVQALKAHDHDPTLRLKPITQRKLAAAQILMRAHQQTELIDNRLVAKAERERERALDKLLSRKYRPLSKRAKQGGLFG